MQKTMQAAVYAQYGGPEVLQMVEVPLPTPGPDEVVVRVRAVALNRLDLEAQAGRRFSQTALPHIGGSEVAGEVAQSGEQVRGFELGQPVVIAPYLYDPKDLYSNNQTDQILGITTDGGYAEYVKVPSRCLVKLPEEMSFEEGATQALTTLTAWHGLVAKAGVRPGEVVLVWAAGSGIGSAAIQIARMWGAQVIAVAGTAAKLEKADAAGAEFLLNHTESDIPGEVLRLTDGRGADVVMEMLGQTTWDSSLKCVARGGRLVACGAVTGSVGQVNIEDLSRREIMLLGSNGGTAEELKEILHFVSEGRLNATVDQVLPFAQIQNGQNRLLSRQQYGKVVLTL